MPEYVFETFRQVCDTSPSDVIPIDPVPETAERDFQLRSRRDLLAFIANNGMEQLTFVNTKDWERNPNPNTPIPVDGYTFMSSFKKGYFAYFFNPKTKKWIIKSFHLSDDASTIMSAALIRAGLVLEGPKK